MGFLVIKYFLQCSIFFYASIITWDVDVLVRSCCQSISDALGLGVLTCSSERWDIQIKGTLQFWRALKSKYCYKTVDGFSRKFSLSHLNLPSPEQMTMLWPSQIIPSWEGDVILPKLLLWESSFMSSWTSAVCCNLHKRRGASERSPFPWWVKAADRYGMY